MTPFDKSWSPQNETLKTVTEEHASWLLRRVDAFILSRQWTEGYFSKVAAGDVGVVGRLRETGKVTAAKMAEIEIFLDQQKGSEPVAPTEGVGLGGGR